MKKRPKRPYDPQKRGGNYNMMPQFQMPFFFNPMNNGGYMKSIYLRFFNSEPHRLLPTTEFLYATKTL